MANWMKIWEEKVSQDYKKTDIECLFLLFQHNPPKHMLDIGCGFAWESRAMNQRFGTQLWLLDGNASDSKPGSKDVGWRSTGDKMAFYNILNDIDLKLKELGTKDYTLIDANNINIPDDLKFDLIYSGISCGFHYPADTYETLIQKHSHKNTKIIFDLRKKRVNQGNIKIVEKLLDGPKHVKCQIQFVNQS
jgi:SAM-dependent methyltransferase